MKKYNFYAGPSYLDESVLNKAIELIENKEKLSFLEISHRSETITALFEETRSLIKELMNLKDDKKILFLHGGASLQFAMIPMNIQVNKTVAFVNTGTWTAKAIKEAQKLRSTKIIASSEEDKFNSIPTDYKIDNDLGYLHLTSNNTIYGTQFHDFPKTNVPLVVDMSSDLLSRDMDFNQFDLIFAGFQKNLGTAGGCLVIINKDLIDCNPETTPSMLDYNVHIKGNSMFNTPPVFTVLMANLTLKWIKENGGLTEVERRNTLKANMLYDEIDSNPNFSCSVAKEDRSIMNVCFDAKDEDTEKAFLAFCEEKNIIGIKGHRVKGGFRASLYNSMPVKVVEYLVDVMKLFNK
jgi:phosphoserine aminotransferase